MTLTFRDAAYITGQLPARPAAPDLPPTTWRRGEQELAAEDVAERWARDPMAATVPDLGELITNPDHLMAAMYRARSSEEWTGAGDAIVNAIQAAARQHVAGWDGERIAAWRRRTP